ncbi:MAG: C4-dicarboxylate ABC transporter substrate-binding protein, partial [Proteobacteria bacterium]|nr:C4-dicarboxylate ABC transporter substrate-binding protein [Pseudomonadota bacterium]
MNQKLGFIKLQFMLAEFFGLGRSAVLSAIILIFVVLALGIFLFYYLAPPNTITITSGPDGSQFHKIAERYAKILGRDGITLRILPSEGSVGNIRRLADPSS